MTAPGPDAADPADPGDAPDRGSVAVVGEPILDLLNGFIAATPHLWNEDIGVAE